MADKMVQIKLKNVHRAYQDQTSRRGREFLCTLFPELDKRIIPHENPKWCYKNETDQTRWMKINKHQKVKKEFAIKSSYVAYHLGVRIKYLPIHFLKDIGYFKTTKDN